MASLVVMDAALIQKTRENQGVVVRRDSLLDWSELLERSQRALPC